MTTPTTTPTPPQRPHPLLFDACRCGPGWRMRCMVCLRWQRHGLMVEQRRHAWGASA